MERDRLQERLTETRRGLLYTASRLPSSFLRVAFQLDGERIEQLRVRLFDFLRDETYEEYAALQRYLFRNLAASVCTELNPPPVDKTNACASFCLRS